MEEHPSEPIGRDDWPVAEETPASYPADEEVPGVVTGQHDLHGQSKTSNAAQSSRPFDEGVDPEHLRSPSQGARPEDDDEATRPGAPGSTTAPRP